MDLHDEKTVLSDVDPSLMMNTKLDGFWHILQAAAKAAVLAAL